LRGLNPALALATAILLIVMQPGADLAFLAPVALTPLLVACARERSVLRRFLLGWSAGVVYWWGVCYWIQFVLEYHGGMGTFLSWLAFILFCVLKALHLGLFAMLAGWLMPRWYAIPAVAALWTGLERTHGTFGFAWLALGNAGADMSLPARLAPWVGVYGLSFVFVTLAAALAVVALRRSRRELAWLAVLPAMWLLPALPPPARGTQSAVLLQPNLDEETEWTPVSADEMQKRLLTRSMESALDPRRPKPQLIIWPEVPAPIYYFTDPTFQRYAGDLARTTGTHFLFGTVGYTHQDQPLNSAVMLAPDGRLIDRYDKIFLVPFGEFIPPLFSWVNRITKEAGDFAPGSRIVVFPVAPGQGVGTFICYESAFPHLVRRFALAGAGVLANISNDGYFGHSAAREQHLKLVRMRAIENRRWILRSTNDGLTAAVDPAGRVVMRLPPYREMVARAQYSFVNGTTFYTRHGDWFAWSCLFAGVALSLAGAIRRSSPSPAPATGN
jgi:apolipoprotein N-acyltransferase